MADMNFNFDLSAFNKGIDEIQKRIQQLGNALKVATDPKSVKALTSALQEANNELDSLKSNLSGLGTSLSQTLPNIGNAIASSMNLATTSMDAMVNSSAQLVAQLRAAQGMATQPFVQQVVTQQQTQPKPGPAGGAMFGAGGDVNSMNRTNQSINNLTDSLNESSLAMKSASLDWSNFVQGLQDGTITLGYAYENVGNAYSELAKKVEQLRSVALNTAAAMESMGDKESDAYKRLEQQLKNVNQELNKYAGQKHKVETAMGGSGKSRFQNELFSVQQILREMPAFTYSVQTGILALSNNLPILVDDFKRMQAALKATDGAGSGFWQTLGMMAKELVSVTGIITIVTGVLTVFGPQIWNLITGTKELTEAEKELNKELEKTGDSYNKQIAAVIKSIAILNSAKTSVDDKILSLRELERITGKDLVSSYDNMTKSINAARLASNEYIKSIKETIELERNRAKMEFAVGQILDAEAVKRGVKAKKAFDYEKINANLEKQSTRQLEKLLEKELSGPAWINLLQKVGGIKLTTPEQVEQMRYLVESIVKIRKYSDSASKLSGKAVSNVISGVGDALTKIEDLKKASEQKIQEELATLAKQGKLTDDEQDRITIANKKKLINDIRKLSKDASEKDKKFIFQEEEKIWIELAGIGKKAAKRQGKEREDTVRTFVEKEVNIEKQLIEDRRNLEKLRLEIIKDSYDKQALIIEEKYDEMAEKARQRNEDELKILKDNFENRIEFQREEADIREKAAKMNKAQADAYVEREMDLLRIKKDSMWKDLTMGKNLQDAKDRYVYSQVIRSNEIMAQTIKRQQENLYKELTDMARGYALARFNDDRTLLKKNLLENIISNEETLKIQLNQYKVFLEKMNKFDQERTFRFYKSPLVANIKVGKNEVETFVLDKLPEYENELNKLIKTDPSSERIGILQNAISKLKGEIVDFNDIFKDSINGYEKLKEVRDADIKDVEDSKMTDKEKADAIALINSRYEKMIVYLDKYNQLLKASKGDVKDMYSPEDAQKVNALQDEIVMLTEKKRELQKEMDESTGTENVDINKKIIATTNKISLLNQAIVKFNESIKEANAAKLAFGKLIPEMQKDMPEFSLKQVPAINTKAVFADKTDINNVSNLKTVLDNAASLLKEGNLEESNKKLREAAGIVAALKGKLTDEEKALLSAAFKTQWEEGSKLLEDQLDKKRGEMVAKTVRKGNLTEVPKEFSRREMWAQNKLNLDLEGAEIEHQRKMLQLKKDTIGVTEKELEEFHKKEMEFIQKRKTFIADNIREIADSIGSVFQTTFDQISTFANNSMQLENERMALMQAQSDNLVASYDRQIDKLKEIMDTQIMSADERINAEQRVLDLERLKAQEEKNQKIRSLELQKKQIDINKKLALAQAAISGGVALANVVAIATEGASGTGPAAPFVFAAQLAAGIGAVSGAIFSAKQAIESADLQTATIDEQIAGIESAYQAGLSKGAGVTSAFASGQGPSAPLTTFNKDLVNQGQASANYNVNDTLKGYKIYVTQADIQNANNQVTKITKKVTFG